MDMCFHWIKDRIIQNHVNVLWKPGPTNLEDYHSKHRPEARHIQVISTNLHETNSSQSALQGCVNSHNRYTTVMHAGLNQGPHTNRKHHGINQPPYAVTAANG